MTTATGEDSARRDMVARGWRRVCQIRRLGRTIEIWTRPGVGSEREGRI